MLRNGLISLSLALLISAGPTHAQEWLSVETDRFTVISELGERDTERWIREFDRFVSSLQGLIPANEALLPPLTVVLFRRRGSFAPYRIRTESGVVRGNSGVFISYPSWSLLGMPGVRGSSTDNSTIYHEAVHWYMSADPTPYPLWFREGIAEVFSTFETEGDLARWGRPILRHLEFMQAFGFQPMREFLAATQDEAMHTNATYYAQSWLFVHYLLFSQIGEGRELLSPLLRNSEGRTPMEAFRETFDFEPEDMDRNLRDYARGRMIVATSDVADTDGAEFVVQPASQALVELSLARLAFGTRNEEPLSGHLERLLEIAPESAEAYDLMAAIGQRAGEENIESILDDAIARGSRDARTYELKALAMTEAARRNEGLFSPTAFDTDVARQIANYLVSAANLRPINERAYLVLADVLFSVDETHEYDRLVFENGAAVYPESGMMLIGQAALAHAANDIAEALRLLGAALQEPYELDDDARRAAEALRRRLEP